MGESYIKFDCKQVSDNLPAEHEISGLNKLRQYLYAMGFIGALPDGDGFGNVSKKSSVGKVVVSCSKTGSIRDLSREHFACIEGYDISKNFVKYSGKLPASSEAMTHLAIYGANEKVNVVAHIHNERIWNLLISAGLKTNGNADYGTVEIAMEAYNYVLESKLSNGIFALAGHKDGIIIYAENFDKIIKLLNEYI